MAQAAGEQQAAADARFVLHVQAGVPGLGVAAGQGGVVQPLGAVLEAGGQLLAARQGLGKLAFQDLVAEDVGAQRRDAVAAGVRVSSRFS